MVACMQRLSIGPLAPFLKEDLALTSAQVGSFMSAAAFGYIITLIPAGWLVDRIGVRWMLLTGEVIGGLFISGMFSIKSFTPGLVFMALARDYASTLISVGDGYIQPLFALNRDGLSFEVDFLQVSSWFDHDRVAVLGRINSPLYGRVVIRNIPGG